MALYDEEELRKKEEKGKKLKKGILVGIIVTTTFIIATMIFIIYLIQNPNKITIYVDGKENLELENVVKIEKTEDGTQLYMPIKRTAELFGFSAYNGEYTTNFEDANSCNVQDGNEVTVFILDSNIIYKINPKNNDSEYEAIKLGNNITKIYNELYINIQDLKSAFNMNISNFDESTKKISIVTLESLVEASDKIAVNAGYEKTDEKFANKKAVLDNMIVVQNKNRKYGVIDGKANVILQVQYDEIEYIYQKKAFLVKVNDKVGIYSPDKNIQIMPQYAELKLIDADNELYLVKNENEQYGVIDITGETKIFAEYEKIGVDLNNFKRNGIKNGYVLVGNLIPVKQNGKWRFFKIEATTNSDGVKMVNCKNVGIVFDDIGCVSSTTGNTLSNVMVVEDYGVVVVKNYKGYGFMDENGRKALEIIYSDVYMETTSGKTNYYVINGIDGKTYNLEEELEKKGYTKIGK